MNAETENNLIETYYAKIEEFLKIDELNIKEVQMSLPSVRHYWVGRLMFHKQQVAKFKKAKEKAAKKLKEKLEAETPVGLTAKTIAESISQHELVLKIDEEIANNEMLIDFLTRVEANFRDAQFGLNNLTKIITLETT